MKNRIILTIIFVMSCALSSCNFAYAQSIDKITRRCATTGGGYATILVKGNGDISYNPCASRSSFFGERVQLVSDSYVPILSPRTSYFSAASNLSNRITIPAANTFQGVDFNFPISISGTNKFYSASNSWLNITGSAVAPQIIANWIDVQTNGLAVSGSSSAYGTLVNMDVGAPIVDSIAIWGAAQSGGAGAIGAGTITGVRGSVGMAHNATTTNAFGGDFWLTSSVSTPSTVTLASAVRAKADVKSGLTVASLRGVAVTDWTNTGAVTNAYGIYIDNSISIGGTSNFAIYSLSTAPVLLSSDVYVSDLAKGVILKSPDGTCYRYTAANGGALNAGVSVTCPA